MTVGDLGVLVRKRIVNMLVKKALFRVDFFIDIGSRSMGGAQAAGTKGQGTKNGENSHGIVLKIVGLQSPYRMQAQVQPRKRKIIRSNCGFCNCSVISM